MSPEDALKHSVSELVSANDCDLYVFCSEVNEATADTFVRLLRDHTPKRRNCALLLTTYGGDPNAGYRMVRAVRRYYADFILYVFGNCKSTGTLIALGCDQVVMSDFGEFGPLDIQLAKDDEMSNTSGLSYLQSLVSLNEQIYKSFETNFLNIKQKSGFTITTRTAAEIASKLAVGLIAPISSQLDPVKLGEVQRAIKIADSYGRRMCDDRAVISRLIAGYPSHGFVIDFEEAKSIFPSVRFVNQNEARLERLLLTLIRNEGESAIIERLDPNPPSITSADNQDLNDNGDGNVANETEPSINESSNGAKDQKKVRAIQK